MRGLREAFVSVEFSFDQEKRRQQLASFGWLDSARASLQAKMCGTRKKDFEEWELNAKPVSHPAIKPSKTLVVAVLGCH